MRAYRLFRSFLSDVEEVDHFVSASKSEFIRSVAEGYGEDSCLHRDARNRLPVILLAEDLDLVDLAAPGYDKIPYR